MIQLTPIGYVQTPYSTTAEAPRQGTNTNTTGTVHIEEEYVEGLAGFEPDDDVIILWFADDAGRSLLSVDRHDNRGVFTTRSPARPNPICLTTTTIRSIGKRSLTVEGVDMRDGSPVLDLKPPLD
jgi:tRNA-Thr(GGU) m(6)t(6)A37 methyltransferase TsaA